MKKIEITTKEYLEYIRDQLIKTQNNLDSCIENMDPELQETKDAEDESSALFEVIDKIQRQIDSLED